MARFGLPGISSKIPADLKQFLDRVREWMTDADRAMVAKQDLINAGLADVDRAGNVLPADPGAFSSIPPPVPLNVIANGAMTSILVEWDAPLYPNHAYAEIWASGVDDLGQAVLVGTSLGTMFAHAVGAGQTRYYWVRFISRANIVGPYNAVAGTPGETSNDPEWLLGVLEGQLTENQLYQDLTARIDLIDGTGAGSVNARIGDEATARADADTALASSVNTLQTTVSGHTTSIQTQQASVDGVLGKYSVKIDNNGYVTGFGLISAANNGTPVSEFAIVADKFSIAPVATDPATADGSPFFYLTTPTVINGVTVPAGAYMKAAYIADASITNAKIANAAIDDAKIISLSADKLRAGSIAVDQAIQSSNFISGTTGWKIAGNGAAELSNAVVRGAVYASQLYVGSASLGISWNGTDFSVNSPQLTISNGNATFSGDLSAATGTFVGSLQAATGVFSGALDAATGTFAGALSAATGTFGGSLMAGVLDLSTVEGESFIYASPGRFNLSIPADKTSVRITCIGAGGGGGGGGSGDNDLYFGGGGGGGGGAGVVSIATFSGVGGVNLTINVGTGGNGATGFYLREASGYAGTAGTASSVTGYIWSPGGGGGEGGRGGDDDVGPGTGGAGGSIGGSIGGGAGGIGNDYDWEASAPIPPGGVGGVGGQTGYGAAGSGGIGGFNNYQAGTAGGHGAGGAGGGGGGGGGRRGAGGSGGNGGNGLVIVEYFNPNAVVLSVTFNAFLTKYNGLCASLGQHSYQYYL